MVNHGLKTMPRVRMTPSFTSARQKYRQYEAQIAKAVRQLEQFGPRYPSLQSHPIQTTDNNMWLSKVQQVLRIIWHFSEDGEIVLDSLEDHNRMDAKHRFRRRVRGYRD